jgi:NO-binding membrane sensor protein with MHYT domain
MPDDPLVLLAIVVAVVALLVAIVVAIRVRQRRGRVLAAGDGRKRGRREEQR